MGKATYELGRPGKCDKPELIKAISRLALSGSAAHERRRNEVIRTVKTLDQLTEALNREGFELKRSSVYLHLLPKNHRTIEGKRHRSSFTKHKTHIMPLIHQRSLPTLQSEPLKS